VTENATWVGELVDTANLLRNAFESRQIREFLLSLVYLKSVIIHSTKRKRYGDNWCPAAGHTILVLVIDHKYIYTLCVKTFYRLILNIRNTVRMRNLQVISDNFSALWIYTRPTRNYLQMQNTKSYNNLFIIHNSIQWQGSCDHGNEPTAPTKAGNLLTTWATVSQGLYCMDLVYNCFWPNMHILTPERK
jgi:hypothetical protein